MVTSSFTSRLGALKQDYALKEDRLVRRQADIAKLEELRLLYLDRAKALQYIVMLSNDGTKALRDYMEGIINRALSLVFGENVYKFSLISDLKAQKVHLNLLEYKNGQWNELVIGKQTGDGMGQIIAFLFSVVLTEITNHRMLFVVDEIMGGLHEKAVELVQRCIAEFEGHGGQFAMIEYTFEEFGKELLLAFDSKKERTTIVDSREFPLLPEEKAVAIS
jgi:hypothetical protein